MKKVVFYISLICVLIFIFLNLTNQSVCVDGAVSGLILCGNVIIPSLFPFTVCVIFILKTEILNSISFLNKFSLKVFGLNYKLFSVFLLSMLGGYPIGAKILNEPKYKTNACVMINYCVNAGPAFIILAVGNGMLGSQKIGFVLFISHILTSIILACFYKKEIKTDIYENKNPKFNIIDNFVLSVSESACTVFNICSFVILFSTIINYINFYSEKFSFIKYFVYFLEITNAVSQTKNILLVSFLLGFGGICVWLQVLSLGRNIKINITKFVISRIFHGLISSSITMIILKIFNISVTTLSNGKTFSFSAYTNSLATAISLMIMGIILIISLYSKKITGNILQDLV